MLFKKISEIAFTKSGGTPSRANKIFWGGDIPWLKSGELNDSYNIVENTEFINEIAIQNSSASIFPKGTLLLAMYGATAGKLGILGMDAATNQAVCSIQNRYGLFVERFLFNYLLFKREDIIKDSFGGAQPNISKTYIDNILVPLPTLSEQKRIVDYIDSAFEKIDNSMLLLEENLYHSKALMGSMLDEVFTNLEHTSQVVKISKIAVIKGGKRLPKGVQLQDKRTDFPYIRVTDFNDNGSIDLDSIKYITKEIQSKISRYIITSDDLYISIAGTIGKTGIIPKELDGANLTENAARFVYKDKRSISNKFVYYYTKSDKFKAFVAEATKQVAQPKLALTRLNEIRLALPSIIEQEKAVVKFLEMENSLLKMEKEIQMKLDNMNALKRSILDQSFKEKL